MSSTAHNASGSVVSLWRYPVKSMMGEELNSSDVTKRGLLGDRAYALVDSVDGKIVSAKNPRKWGNLFDFRAAFVEPPRRAKQLPPVRITLPNGTIVSSAQDDINRVLSHAAGREVTLERSEAQEEIVETEFLNPWRENPSLEEYWPDIEGLAHRDAVTDEKIPEGTFFDCAVIHVLTTATIDGLRELYPQGRFEVRRFRPNIVVGTSSGEVRFLESEWVGKTISIGDEVRIQVSGPCPRCVMTTLAQGDLSRDPGILRTAARHNQTHVGIYAKVMCGGTIRRGDSIRVE